MPSLEWQPEARLVAREDAPHLPGIRVMSPTHHAILEHIIANPGMRLGEIAQYFGVTQPWLSCIVHSDCFQEKLAQAQVELYGDVRQTVRDKLQSLAQLSLARLTERIELETKTDSLVNAAEMAVRALGFTGQNNGKQLPGVTASGNVQVNQYQYFGNVTPESLAQAREMMLRRTGTAPEEARALEEPVQNEPAAGELPAPAP